MIAAWNENQTTYNCFHADIVLSIYHFYLPFLLFSSSSSNIFTQNDTSFYFFHFFHLLSSPPPLLMVSSSFLFLSPLKSIHHHVFTLLLLSFIPNSPTFLFHFIFLMWGLSLFFLLSICYLLLFSSNSLPPFFFFFSPVLPALISPLSTFFFPLPLIFINLLFLLLSTFSTPPLF